MKSFDGYLKKKLGDSYVLLAGGGAKLLSDFSMSNHSHNYAGSNSPGGHAYYADALSAGILTTDLNANTNQRNRIYWHDHVASGLPVAGYGNVLQLSNVDNPKFGTSGHWITQIDFLHGGAIYHRSKINMDATLAWKRLYDDAYHPSADNASKLENTAKADLLSAIGRETNTNNIYVTVGGTTKKVALSSLAWDSSHNHNDLYVTAVGNGSGNYINQLYYTKNGSNNYFTVNYANNSDMVDGYHANNIGTTSIAAQSRLGSVGATHNYILVGSIPLTADTGTGESKVLFTVYGMLDYGARDETICIVTASSRGGYSLKGTILQGANQMSLGYVLTSSAMLIWLEHTSYYRGCTSIRINNSTNFTLIMSNQNSKPSGWISGNLYINYSTENLPAYPTKASWNYDDVYSKLGHNHDSAYVASVSISGNYLRINKNGVNTDLTIPYATNAGNASTATKLLTARTIWGQSFDGTNNVSGNLTFLTGSSGMYGFVPEASGAWRLHLYTEGAARITIRDSGQVGIGNNNPGTAYKLDVSGNLNGTTLYQNGSPINSLFVSSLGVSGNYLTWTKNGTTNNITIPYATSSNVSNYLNCNKQISVSPGAITAWTWYSTGILGTSLDTGIYVLRVSISTNGPFWSCNFVGLLYWFSSGTNASEADEVIMHSAGHANNSNVHIYIRTLKRGSSTLLMLMTSNINLSAYTYTFRFFKIGD